MVTFEFKSPCLVICEPGDSIPLEIIASNQSAQPEYALFTRQKKHAIEKETHKTDWLLGAF